MFVQSSEVGSTSQAAAHPLVQAAPISNATAFVSTTPYTATEMQPSTATPPSVAPAVVPAAAPAAPAAPAAAAAPAQATADDGGEGKEGGGEKKAKGDPLIIPKAAVKRIMKLDSDVNQVANDAVILVAKATELFLEKFSRDAHAHALSRNRRSIKYEDVADARAKDPTLEFMKGVVPLPREHSAAPQPSEVDLQSEQTQPQSDIPTPPPQPVLPGQTSSTST